MENRKVKKIKNKKLFLFIALNSLAVTTGIADNSTKVNYDKLYNKITNNMNLSKSNKENYKLIEDILNLRNKELKDLYTQGDYIIKPEYLEWQIFFSGFYEKTSRGEGFKEVIAPYTKEAKTVSLGMYIPIRNIEQFSISPEVNNKSSIVINAFEPNTIEARSVNIFNIEIPQIDLNITPPSFNITPQVINEKDIKLITNLQAPQVPLNDIKVFNLKLDTQTNPLNTNTVIGNQVLSSASANDIILKISSGYGGLNGNNEVDRAKASAILLEKGIADAAPGGVITLRNSETAGLAISPDNTINSYNPNPDFQASNYGTIIGEQAATGIYTKQIGLGYIPSGAKNIQVNMKNDGIITMKSPNSAGFLLMPDIDQDYNLSAYNDYNAYLLGGRITYDGGLAYADPNSYDERNVRQYAINNGTINVYGSRSYGFMTSPYSGDDIGHNFGVSTRYFNTSLIQSNGIINVLGDESTGFAIKKGINQWTNAGTINIGSSTPFTQDNVNGNTIYLEDGTPDTTNPLILSVGNSSMVERATGMYTNQTVLLYTSDLNNPFTPTNFYENQQGSAENSATINIWENATESSGLRSEVNGFIMNRGSINIYGDKNYGIVGRDKTAGVFNITYTFSNPGIYNNVTKQWEVQEVSGREAHINVNSQKSAGGYTDRGGNVNNTGYIDVSGDNSVGFYVKSGAAINEDRTDEAANYHYGRISTTGQNSHGVLITNEDALGAGFENRAVVQTSAEGTVAVYAVNSSSLSHNQSTNKETHFVEDPNSPGNSITVADWLLNGGTPIGTDGYGSSYGLVTLTTDYKQNALIKTGDGGTGIWLEQTNPTFTPVSTPTNVTRATIAAPIEVGNTAANYSAIGVYSDGIGIATFNKGSLYNLDPIKYYKDIASIKVGTGGIALLQNYKGRVGQTNARDRFGSSTGIFDIQALSADLGDNSTLAYSNGGNILTEDLSNVTFSNIGNNVTLAFSSNNGTVTVNDTHLSDFLLNPGTVSVGTGLTPFVSENGEAKNTVTGSTVGSSGIGGLVLNTSMGLQSYSKNGTLVTVNKANTKTTNDGVLTMTGNIDSVVGTYTKFGILTNTTNGIINTDEVKSIAMYGVENSDISNNGLINTLGSDSIGIYSLSNDTAAPLSATGGININSTGIINMSGDGSAGIYAQKNGTTGTNYTVNNSGAINIKNSGSVGIYADNVNIVNIGTIDLSDTISSTTGGRIAVYGNGASSMITTTGANINLGQIDQTQVAYFIANGGKLSGSNLGTVNGYGILILSDNSTIDAGVPAITSGNGQIALALKGSNTINYTGEIKTGNTVTVGSDKFYGVALYADTQNISSLSNKLTAGSSGVGLYAGGGTGTVGTGSSITYNGQIEVGDGISSGIGIYVKAGSNVNFASGGSIKINGLGIGAFVEGSGEFTFGSGSSMTFTDSGVGIWGENGAIINDNGTGIINSLSPTGSVTRSRAANGIINITGPVTTIGNGMAGFVTNGEVNNLAGSTIVSSPGTIGTTAMVAERYKTVGSNQYEANNFGIIDLQNTDKGTGIYVKNARAYNDVNAIINLGSNGVGIYAENAQNIDFSEIRNNGNITMLGIQSIGLYGNGASLIENNGSLNSSITGNIGIYSKVNSLQIPPVTTIINNKSNILLSDNGVGIYGENSNITNTGNITVGNKTGTDYSIGIHAKDSIVTNTGNIKTGSDGIAFVTDNSILNLNSGNLEVLSGSLVYGKNNSIINYNLGDKVITGVNPYVNIENSTLNLLSPTKLSVSDNGVGIFVFGNTGVITGDLTLDLNSNALGIYVKDLGTAFINNSIINVNGVSSSGIISENSDIINTGTIKVNGNNGAGILSELTNAGTSNMITNTGNISVSNDNGIGIYATAKDSTGVLLGNTTINNNGNINLGSTTDINTKAQIGIYGSDSIDINNNTNINGGEKVIGIYSKGSNVTTNGSINVGNSSVAVYLEGGNLTTSGSSVISTGDLNGVGIYASNGAQIINNSSNITAGKSSVLVYGKDSGTLITNNAILSIGELSTGFYIDSSKVNNLASLNASGSNAVFFYGKNGEIENNGTLNALGNKGLIAIYGENSKITNNGNINLNDSVINFLDSTKNNYSVGIYGENSIINNTSQISIGENGVGIYSNNNTGVSVVNHGNLISSKLGAIGMFAENGNIQNDGTIVLDGENSIGMAVRSSTAINNGYIVINGANGIGIYGTSGSHIYNNNEITINGNDGIGIQLAGGSVLENRGIINLNGSNNTDIIYGEGTQYKLPSIVNAGIINVNEKFIVNGIEIKVKVEPSTMRVPTASEIALGGYAKEDINGEFLVSNAVQFNAPSFELSEPVKITSDFSQGTNATVYKLENIFNPNTPWGGPNNGTIAVVSDSLVWDAIPTINDSGNIDIWMEKQDYSNFTNGHWYNDFANALDLKYDKATGDGLKIYDKIDKIKTTEEFNHIMNSLSGNVYANINQREEDIATTFENSLNLLKDSTNNTKENVKINIIAGKGKTKENTDGVVGYDYTTTGVLALREVERTYRHTFGYSLGYLHTGFEFDDNNNSEEWVDTIQIGAHNKYKNNDWVLRNDVTGRVSMHNIDRNINWADSGRSEMNGMYETYSITSDNTMGKELEIGKNTKVTPYGGIKAMYVTRPTFEEEGLESIQMEGNDAWSVKPRVGIELKSSLPLGVKTGWKLKGSLDIFYEYELANLNTQEKARLVSVEDGYHNLNKPEDENGKLKTRAIFGVEIEDRYGIFINGEYSVGSGNEDDYRAGVTLKAVF